MVNSNLKWFTMYLVSNFPEYAIQVRSCFSKKKDNHIFHNAGFIRGHFSRIHQIGLMSVARFSWVPNSYHRTILYKKITFSNRTNPTRTGIIYHRIVCKDGNLHCHVCLLESKSGYMNPSFAVHQLDECSDW